MQKFIISLFTPAFFFLLLGGMMLLHMLFSMLYRRLHFRFLSSFEIVSKSQFRLSYFNTLLSLFLTSYTQISTTVLSYLNCTTILDHSVVESMPAIDCNSSSYGTWKGFTIFLLITDVIGVPVLLFLLLWRHRQQIQRYKSTIGAIPNSDSDTTTTTTTEEEKKNEEKIKQDLFAESPFVAYFKIMFEPYIPAAFYYNVFVLGRRTALVSVSVFLDSAARSLGLTLLNIIFFAIQLLIHPYQDSMTNRLESVGLFMLCVLASVLGPYRPPYSVGLQIIITLLVLIPFLGGGIFVARGVAQKQLKRVFTAFGKKSSESEKNGEEGREDSGQRDLEQDTEVKAKEQGKEKEKKKKKKQKQEKNQQEDDEDDKKSLISQTTDDVED